MNHEISDGKSLYGLKVRIFGHLDVLWSFFPFINECLHFPPELFKEVTFVNMNNDC